MKKIKNIILRLFYKGVWAENDTLVGVHPDGAINCEANGAIARNSLVKLSSGKVVASGAAELPLGVAQDNVVAGERVAVKLLGNATGTIVGIASEAISQGDALYAVADGKVAKTKPVASGTHYLIGYALTSAAADGELEIQHHAPVAVVVD